MIRQAISCDICGAEKKQTNHWFVASEQAGELRVSGWDSRNKLRTGTKHLCGQTCLHKLVDEFMASLVADRKSPSAADLSLLEDPLPDVEASLTSNAAYSETERIMRAVNKPTPLMPSRPAFAAPAIPARAVAAPIQSQPSGTETRPLAPVEITPNYASRHWRAEAWERERERELHAVERRTENSPRRRNTT